MDELIQYEKDIIAILKKMDIDKDSCVGILLQLGKKEHCLERHCKLMLEWLKANPDANRRQLYNKLHDIID